MIRNSLLLNRINIFLRLASLKDSEILDKLSSFDTFKDRVDYAEANLEHLSSGSSRVIYIMGDGTVLKLAKNDRGIAQNKVEANPKMKSKFINKTLKSNKDGIWKTSPFLDKITEKEFEKMTGIPFKDFGEALEYGLQDVSDDKADKPDNFDEISKKDIYKDLVKNGKEFMLLPGDMSRISSWLTDGKIPMLGDSGLTSEIYSKYYTDEEKKSRKSKQDCK